MAPNHITVSASGIKTATCATCSNQFVLKLRSTARCCSEICRKARQRKREREARANPEQRARRLRQKADANGNYSKRHRAKVRAYYQRKRVDDPSFAMACWMRSTLHKVLERANKRKDASCVALLGYDQAELKAHIEAQFVKGMGWYNRSEWHIDHVIPVAEMLRRGEDDPRVVNALSNLRPMWARDNIVKSDKVLSLL